MTEGIDRIGYGPFESLPTFFSSTALGTTPTKVTLPTTGLTTSQTQGRAVRLTIVNGSSSATVAWSTVARASDGSSVAPTITADYNATTGAAHLPPLTSQTFAIPVGHDLYVVASGAGTSVNVTSFLYLLG